jgi:hypothetical protein
MNMNILRIRDWSEHFENNRTKELVRMAWVPVPNKQDGDGYTELLDHVNGAAHLGAWIAIVELASTREDAPSCGITAPSCGISVSPLFSTISNSSQPITSSRGTASSKTSIRTRVMRLIDAKSWGV